MPVDQKAEDLVLTYMTNVAKATRSLLLLAMFSADRERKRQIVVTTLIVPETNQLNKVCSVTEILLIHL